MKKKLTSIRLSEDAKRLIVLMSEKLGISQTAIIELAIREKANREKIK
jgi:hypothetical protein